MRRIFLLVSALSTLASVAQDNNPYDSKGLEYVASIKMVKDDFKAGKVKHFTEESLQYYSNLVPLKDEVNPDVTTKVVQTLKNGDVDFNSMVNEWNLTTNSKQLYLEFYNQSVRVSGVAFRDYLRKKLEIIKKSRMPDSERESLLSLAATLYHEAEARNGCVTTTAEGVMVDDSGTGCIVLGMAAGYLAGNIICGTLCGIGGAIVGGIIGAMT